MSARLLAAFCLFASFASESRAESKLVVYLAAADQPAGPVGHMKRELGAIMLTAGYRVEWQARGQAGAAPDAPFLAVVELEGVCAAEAGRGDTSLKLARTPVSDGRVLPFSTVACGALRQAIAPAIAGQAPAVREFLMGRAMARVVAHELYHVLVGTTEHSGTGIARSCYTASDLVGERFGFGDAVLARLRPAETVADLWEEATGRQ
jgi:hypothetical protein